MGFQGAPRTEPIPPRHRPPQFGAGGDLFANAVGLIDSNRFVELVCSDFMAMIIPRTAIAYYERGTDDARETFIREFSGLVGNMFVIGWLSHAAVKTLGSRVNAYNPLGIPARAWVSSTNMDAFQQLYNQSLNQAVNPTEARQHFIKNVLKRLESGDRQFSLEARMAHLQTLAKAQQDARDALAKIQEELPSAHAIPASQDLLQKIKSLGQAKSHALERLAESVDGGAGAATELPAYRALLKDGKLSELKKLLLARGWGRLSTESRGELANYYAQAGRLKQGVKGTHNFDAAAEAELSLQPERAAFAKLKQESKAELAKLSEPERTRKLAELEAKAKRLAQAEIAKLSKPERAQQVVKHRLRLSLEDLGQPTAEFEELISKAALERGLTSTVDLKSLPGDSEILKKALGKGQSRTPLLKELKFFLEQYVDRASHRAMQEMAEDTHGDAWKDQIRHALTNDEKKGFLHWIRPSVEDGLITATRKSKFMYTALPMVLAILTGGAFTFFNVWLTKRKHGGKVFFPGEYERSGGPSSVQTAAPAPHALDKKPAAGAVHYPTYIASPYAAAPSHHLPKGHMAAQSSPMHLTAPRAAYALQRGPAT